MWLIVCCFSVSDKHGQKNNVIWLSTTWLLIFRTQVANKKPLLTKPANWNFLLKRYNFSRLQNLYPIPGCYTGKMLFANASKIIRNWFLTLQPDIFKIICNIPKWHQKGQGCNMSTWLHIFLYALIYALTYLCTCVKERKASLKFLH